MSKQMTGAEMVVQAMLDNGVEHIFGYPGGAVLPIYDAIFQQDKLQHILVRHEQGAAHAAEGYARSTGKVGCVLVTSGPGATNAVTGLTDALMDSIPLVCITGQVPTHLIGNDAFQECDTVGITRPCTKHNYLVKSVNDLARVLHEAFHIAANGRPGPVVVDIPKDVQFATGTYVGPKQVQMKSYQPKVKGDLDKIKAAIDMLANAKKPIIYSGGGIINSGQGGEPSAARVRADDRFSGDVDPDGARRVSGGKPAMARHARHARHLRGELDDARLRRDAVHRRALRRPHHRADRRVRAALAQDPHRYRCVVDQQEREGRSWDRRRLRARAGRHDPDLESGGKAAEQAALAGWWKQIDKWRERDCLAYRPSNETIKPQYAIQRLYELTKDRDVYITTEVGQHQMWAAQFFKFEEPNRWMTSGGLGTMGYGLPASIGVQLAHPKSLVIDIAGEASVQMTMQEMSTAAQYRLPIKIFILNNQYMGMVRQWQELLHGGRYSDSYSEALPDFVKLAEAYQRRRHPLRQAGRSRSRHQGDDQRRQAGDLRLRGRSEGKLLPDDPVRQGAQRDAARPMSKATSRRRSTRRARCWCEQRNACKREPLSGAPVKEKIERHTLSVLVDNEPGVLARVIGLFSGRGYNIDSLTVSETEHEKHLSRITIVTSGTPMVIEQIRHQLERLVQVQRVVDLTEAAVPAIERELAMVKVRGKGENRVEALRLADAFRARVIDAGTESFIFEITGASEKIESFISLMLPLGLVEVSRTGVVAISRGPEGM